VITISAYQRAENSANPLAGNVSSIAVGNVAVRDHAIGARDVFWLAGHTGERSCPSSSRLYEPLASRMAGYIVSFAVVARFSNALWLLMFGVNEQLWREQAKAAGQ